MVINMIVAIASVKLKNVSGLDDFVELDEPLYALFYVWLGFTGAGALSLDYLVSAALGVIPAIPHGQAPARRAQVAAHGTTSSRPCGSHPVALALMLPAAAVLTGRHALAQEQNNSDLMEQLARRKFGALSNAELLLLRSAPEREIKWASPREDPDDPINDPRHGESWGPERTIRAAVLVWLCSDPVASRLVHPSGPGIIAARISGPLDLSYQNVPFPLTLVRCVIKDGVDISYARLRGLDLRACATGQIVGTMAVVTGELGLTFGTYGQVLLYRASIDGTLDFSAARAERPTRRQSRRSNRLSAATQYFIRASQPTGSSISALPVSARR